ncbi:hypothetical protein MMIN_20030 [Mycolicibacter minnesotensis]|nr:hypothetical protein MMIN_00830 [Mycolicibacter minnesotensis]BBY33942.1 hypothetical protein MMIN_20030 [Mycolicibacter minnesotensis]
MPTINNTITTGNARCKNDAATNRGNSGGGSTVIAPRSTGGTGNRRRASKIKRLIGSLPR